jgi:uncharacterized membrane protein YdbT with pleckstrin-like domain
LVIFFPVVLTAVSILFADIFPKPIYLIIGASLFLLLLFLTILSIVFEKRRWSTEQYVITPENVEVVVGLIGMSRSSYGLRGVVAMNVNQSPLAKYLGYGTITLRFMGGGSMDIKNIEEPEKHMHMIQQLMNKGAIEKDED